MQPERQLAIQDGVGFSHVGRHGEAHVLNTSPSFLHVGTTGRDIHCKDDTKVDNKVVVHFS